MTQTGSARHTSRRTQRSGRCSLRPQSSGSGHIHTFIHPSIYQYIHPSIHPSVHPSNHATKQPTIHTSIHPSVWTWKLHLNGLYYPIRIKFTCSLSSVTCPLSPVTCFTCHQSPGTWFTKRIIRDVLCAVCAVPVFAVFAAVTYGMLTSRKM